MSDAMVRPRALIGKAPDADLPRGMTGCAAQRLMELEVGELTGAAYGERSAERLAQRNGCRDRDWQARAGTVELRIAKLRRGSCFPSMSWSKPLGDLQLAVPRGRGSTAALSMGMSGSSKSQVSRPCEEVDGLSASLTSLRGIGRSPTVKALLDRPIEGGWRWLWLDATYAKVRQNGRVVSLAVIVAVGANGDGRREVLGMDVGPSKAETFRTLNDGVVQPAQAPAARRQAGDLRCP